MATFRMTEITTAEREVYIEAETKEEAIEKWNNGDYSNIEDWNIYDDNIDFNWIEKIEKDS